MLENKCEYYVQIFGGVINTAYLCPIIHTKKMRQDEKRGTENNKSRRR